MAFERSRAHVFPQRERFSDKEEVISANRQAVGRIPKEFGKERDPAARAPRQFSSSLAFKLRLKLGTI